MPYLITESIYPLNKADETAKIYMKVLEKFPPDEAPGNELVPAAVTTTKNGIKGLSILEVKQEKLYEAYDRQSNAMVMFRDIEGFNYKVRVWSTVEEALKVIGMG
jgi:hypothetical protein